MTRISKSPEQLDAETRTQLPDSPRLPMPDWSRPGETWRVEPETAVRWTTEVDPKEEGCDRHSVAAVAGYTSRSGRFYLVCADELAESLMWVENGRVVSWRLGRMTRRPYSDPALVRDGVRTGGGA